jgi:glucose/arabinose dehydrogenase
MTRQYFLQPGVKRAPSRLLWQAALLLSAATAACGQAGTTAAATAARPFTVHEVASFSTPWAMAFLPGSGVRLTRLALLTEKEGKLWLVDTATGKRQAVAGVPAVHVAGQGGLGDVVVHPDFAANRRVYLSYVEKGEGGTGAALGYGTLDPSGTRLSGFKLIWRQSPKVDGNGHFSHRIAFGPDGMLYLTSGDRQKFDPAQDMGGNLGKVLRLTPEGAPAPGNPWAAKGGIAATFWTIGHRNLLGLSFAPDGRLWEAEMGPKGGDELNLIVAGKNYGWPRASNGSHYDGRDIPDHKAGDGFVPPKAYWNPSISPGGLLIYGGGRFPQWKGDALIPALSGEALIRVDIKGDRATKADEWPMGARIRAVDEGPDGSVYLIEDEGRLLRLDPAAQTRR